MLVVVCRATIARLCETPLLDFNAGLRGAGRWRAGPAGSGVLLFHQRLFHCEIVQSTENDDDDVLGTGVSRIVGRVVRSELCNAHQACFSIALIVFTLAQIFLRPRSLNVLSGAAYSDLMHGRARISLHSDCYAILLIHHEN